MNIANMEDACDIGLVLGLGQYNPSQILKPTSTTSDPPKHANETSLTLGFPDGQSSSPKSMDSSLSNIKREHEETQERVSISRNSDEDEEGGARKKLRLTKEQSALLEDKFKEHATLNPKQKQALAKQLNLRPRQVEVWFQNRRARTKLKQTEVDCEVLKRCCEKLTEENRRLQKELEELKALKIAAPLSMYMQMPIAPAVTVCPSCQRVKGSSDGSLIIAAPKAQFLNASPFARPTACLKN